MLLKGSVGSNIAARMLLKYHEAGDLGPHIRGYHCDNTRQRPPASRRSSRPKRLDAVCRQCHQRQYRAPGGELGLHRRNHRRGASRRRSRKCLRADFARCDRPSAHCPASRAIHRRNLQSGRLRSETPHAVFGGYVHLSSAKHQFGLVRSPSRNAFFVRSHLGEAGISAAEILLQQIPVGRMMLRLSAKLRLLRCWWRRTPLYSISAV